MTPDETRRLKRIRSRLMRALRTHGAPHLRAAVVEVASDIEAMLEGRAVADEACPDTVRFDERDTIPAPPPAALGADQ